MNKELKTLKDLDFNDWISMPADKFNEFIQNKIKFEAVKWVKYKETIPDSAVIEWIKHFFNLTEEDLR